MAADLAWRGRLGYKSGCRLRQAGWQHEIGVHFVNFDVLGGVEVLPLAVELGCAASPLIRIA
jgi:hypothetical protein